MANKKTRPTTEDEYNLIINTILTGFIAEDGERVRPNPRVAAAIVTEACTGLRINDALQIRLCDIKMENGKYKLRVREQKTNKDRLVYLNSDTFIYLQNLALSLGIQPTAKLFDITARQVQKHLHKVCEYLKLEYIGTHSFRKMFATQLYYKNNCNALLIQKILNHSSIAVTQRYLGLQEKEIEDALENYSMLPKMIV